MYKKKEIVWWETQLTDHQSYTLEELSKTVKLSILVVKDYNKKRVEQGWKSNLNLGLNILPNWDIIFLLKTVYENKNKINVFAGPFENRKLLFASLICLILNSRVYFLSEPYSTISFDYLDNGNSILNFIKLKLRPFLYMFYGKIYLKKILGVFAISELAINQFKRFGTVKNKIYPFGYFVPKLNFKKIHKTNSILRAVFVGSLIQRKGIDYLCEVFKKLNSSKVILKLDIYGPGDSSLIEDKINGVNYCGVIPFGQSQKIMSQYDFSIFPSLFDGWGVVVNESILAGVPVLCSDALGAKCLIEKFGCGNVFSLNKKNDLEEKLISMINNQDRLKDMSKKALTAQKYISPKLAADYIYNIIVKQQRLPSPWYNLNSKNV